MTSYHNFYEKKNRIQPTKKGCTAIIRAFGAFKQGELQSMYFVV